MPAVLSYLIKFTLVFASYFTTAKIGLSLDAVSGFATLVWAPTGISLAALVLFRSKLWPAIFLAAFLVNLTTGALPLVALGIGIGNTLEALLGSFFLRKYTSIETFLDQTKDVAYFVTLAALVSTAVSATIGVSSLYLGGLVELSAVIPTWTSWWIGDMLGSLIFFPFIIIWKNFSIPKLDPKRSLELAVFLLIAILTNLVIFFKLFSDQLSFFSKVYFIFPLLLWAALRFEKRIVTAVIVFTSIAAIIATVQGVSGFATAQAPLSSNLLNLQTFVAVLSIMILSLSSVVSEKKEAVNALRRSNIELDQKVKDQTKILLQEVAVRKHSEERLKKINGLMVGRELKMIEIEKELEKFKKKI